MATSSVYQVIGRVIDGRYEVNSRLARGGLSTVYLAMDRRLGREVVIKIMHPHLARGLEGAAFVSRFRRESRAAARVAHPGIVTVYDQGFDGAISYLVVEYVPGSNLRRELRMFGTLPLGKTLEILDQILAATAAAHRKNLIHRDIKPENMLVDENGAIKISDFGLARAITEVTSVTTGTILGTVAYLAPEIISYGECTPRVDVYAIGILGYEMLTGKHPHSGSSPLEIAAAHVTTDVPSAKAVVSWLPDEVDEMLRHFSARDPLKRPADGEAAQGELRKVMAKLRAEQPYMLARRSPPPVEFEEPETGEIPAITREVLEAGNLADGGDQISVFRNTFTGANDYFDYPVDLDEIPTSAFTPSRGIPLVVPDLAPDLKAIRTLNSAAQEPAQSPPSKDANQGSSTGTTVTQYGNESKNFNFFGKGSKPSQRFAGVTAALLLLAGVGVASWYGGVHSADSRALPLAITDSAHSVWIPTGIVGMQQRDAEPALRAAAVRFGPAETEYCDRAPIGEVIRLSNAEGTLIPYDTMLTMTVSKGPHPVAVPQQVGRDWLDAQLTITELGLKVSYTEAEHSTEVPRGQIMRQVPADGSMARRGDTVVLTVSLGPPGTTVDFTIPGSGITDMAPS